MRQQVKQNLISYQLTTLNMFKKLFSKLQKGPKLCESNGHVAFKNRSATLFSSKESRPLKFVSIVKWSANFASLLNLLPNFS